MATTIQIRRDSSTNWQAVNPILANGEFGKETDTGKIKNGDGVTAWNDLGYSGGGSAGIPIVSNISEAAGLDLEDGSIISEYIPSSKFTGKPLSEIKMVAADSDHYLTSVEDGDKITDIWGMIDHSKFNSTITMHFVSGTSKYRITIFHDDDGYYFDVCDKSFGCGLTGGTVHSTLISNSNIEGVSGVLLSNVYLSAVVDDMNNITVTRQDQLNGLNQDQINLLNSISFIDCTGGNSEKMTLYKKVAGNFEIVPINFFSERTGSILNIYDWQLPYDALNDYSDQYINKSYSSPAYSTELIDLQKLAKCDLVKINNQLVVPTGKFSTGPSTGDANITMSFILPSSRYTEDEAQTWKYIPSQVFDITIVTENVFDLLRVNINKVVNKTTEAKDTFITFDRSAPIDASKDFYAEFIVEPPQVTESPAPEFMPSHGYSIGKIYLTDGTNTWVDPQYLFYSTDSNEDETGILYIFGKRISDVLWKFETYFKNNDSSEQKKLTENIVKFANKPLHIESLAYDASMYYTANWNRSGNLYQ